MHFPLRAYGTVAVMLVIAWYSFRRIRQGVRAGTASRQRGVLAWLLVNYTVLLLFLAVFGRRSLDYYRYRWEPFYSYRWVWDTGDVGTAKLIAANIAVFVPVGGAAWLLAKRWRLVKGLLLGIGLSLCIEVLQLVLRCGTTEVDDLINNSLGTALGCIAAGLLRLGEIVAAKVKNR